MITDTVIPEWYSRDLTRDADDVIPTQSSVTRHDGVYYFTGLIRELIRARKVPRSIDIALDMDEMAAVARLEYEPGGDGLNEEQRFRAVYTYLEIEAFAILWNERPAALHGIPGERISLHLAGEPMEYPIILGHEGGPAILFYDEDRFWVRADETQPDKEPQAA